MEVNQRKNFICKFCNKRYPCGKSLGGHIRIHLNGSSNVIEDEAKLSMTKSFAGNRKRDSGSRAASIAQSGYGLRENAKKTKWYMVDSSKSGLLSEKACKECGKAFQSLKALCGHMACHSKNNGKSYDHCGSGEKLKDLIADSQYDDTEASAPNKRRRSERTRYKTVSANSSSLSLTNGSSYSASDVEQEQEEVAMCLMMLSRDSGFKGGFSSVEYSSDNNPLILDAKKAKQMELKADSEYVKNEPREFESDISSDGFIGNDAKNKHKVEFVSRSDEKFDALSGRGLSRFRHVKVELGKHNAFCSVVFCSGQALSGLKRYHFVGSADDRTLVIKQEAPEIPIPSLIDLNLPLVPVEDLELLLVVELDLLTGKIFFMIIERIIFKYMLMEVPYQLLLLVTMYEAITFAMS
ncbi:hypothetical protein K2173_016965 [Erythroxylum novogranatense]|uniref:C2H2-type domain-containing protein n=1 Tax=Erythroxylum novogranatense TaxID=1862640 RepID=A0AAV8U8L4_9ROSI|nr:hypothetical protein K2173_016965 [Erythroxylum novogranatense]